VPGPGGSVSTLGPHDPNDLMGPSGFGPTDFIQPVQAFPYRIDFQNDPQLATAPAQVVTITEQLDPSLDLGTFQLGAIRFGATTIAIPAGQSSFSTRVDVRSTLGLVVDVGAGLNLQTGVMTWTFTSIDPRTLDLPADPLAGFLPIDTNPPADEGFVSYTIQPRGLVTSGRVINAQASVVFDTAAPVLTNTFVNTIDAGPPTSSVVALPAMTTTPTFTVSWSGQSAPGGSGIASYDVYVSDNGGSFTRWQKGTTQTSATYSGQIGHTYAFYSVATDNVGHVQATPSGAQASTTLVPPSPPPSGSEAIHDVTPRIRITRPKTHGTGSSKVKLLLTNISGQVLDGPLFRGVGGLKKKVKVRGLAGVTTQHGPMGSPYVLVSAGGLGVGQAMPVMLTFKNPTGRAVRFTARLLAGTGTL
jgi:hypothetical protein